MYLVKELRENIELDVYGTTQEIPLHWYKGMIGATPVFETEEALEYAEGDKNLIQKMFYADDKDVVA